VCYASIRLWCNKFEPKYVKRLKHRQQGFGDTLFHRLSVREDPGRQQYLWRAVDQDEEMVDVFLQARRDGAAARRFFKQLLGNNRGEPRKFVKDKLGSCSVAHRELIPDTISDTSRYANNCAELSHQSTRLIERGMRRFKSTQQAQRFLSVHAAVHNLFNLGRNLGSAKHYRLFGQRALASRDFATAD